MKVKVMKDHAGEGQFPTFEEGAKVKIVGAECAYYAGWFPCKINGHGTYIPGIYVREGKLTREYNPTELVQKVGDVLTVQAIVYTWLLATNASGETGWIPAEAVCGGMDE